MIGVLRVEGGGETKRRGNKRVLTRCSLATTLSQLLDSGCFRRQVKSEAACKNTGKNRFKKKQVLLTRSELMLRRRRQTEYLSARWEETVGCYCRWPATWLHLSPLPVVRIKGRSGRRLWSEHFTMSARDISAVKCLFHNDGHPRLSTAFNRLTSHLLFVSPFCL